MNWTGKTRERLSALVKRKPKAAEVTANPTALAERDELLARAKGVSVRAVADQTLGGETVGTLRARVKAVKASRLELARPLQDQLAGLLRVEREYCGPLEAEIERLEREANAVQDAEDKRVAAEESERAAKVVELRDERNELETRLDGSEGREAKAVERQLAKTEQRLDAVVRSDVAGPARAKGQVRREVLKWEVTDLKAAYAANPHLFSVEPRPSAINACCVPAKDRDEANPETQLWPGIRCWWTRETTFRST